MPDPLGTWVVDIKANQGPVLADIGKVKSALTTADAEVKNVTQSMHTLGHGSRGAAQGILALSQAVDDAQYGFRAIVNNIPQMVYMFGGTAGIAGAVGIAAVAVNVLINHWGDLSAAFESWASGDYAGTIKMLATQAEEAAASFEKMATAVTKVQEAQAKGVHAVVTEAPGGASGLTGILAGSMMPSGGAPAGTDPKVYQQYIAELLPVAMKKAQALVGEMEMAGARGDQARSQVVGMLRGIGKNTMASDIENQSPEGQKRQFDFEKAAAARKKIEADIKRDTDAHTHKAEANAKAQGQLAKEVFNEQKRKRIQDLEDKKDVIEARLHKDLEALRGQRPGQILQGQRASLDIYQTASGGGREERAHRLREDANKLLKSMDESLKKERRVIIEH